MTGVGSPGLGSLMSSMQESKAIRSHRLVNSPANIDKVVKGVKCGVINHSVLLVAFPAPF